MARPTHVTLLAETEINGVRYTHHTAISASAWHIADETTKNAFRDLARQRLAEHLAGQLPITITEEPTP